MSSTLQTARDISLQVTSHQASGERRITPAWTIAQLKGKLEPITGIPPPAQRLLLRRRGAGAVGTTSGDEVLEAADEDTTTVGQWNLSKGTEIFVEDLRPPGARQNLTDTSQVEKYIMPSEQYETLSDSVLAWKKSEKLGRFDPAAPAAHSAALAAHATAVQRRNITLNARCRLVSSSDHAAAAAADSIRRGRVVFIGEAAALPAGVWVGVELDEPVGKNDGSVGGERYFTCKPGFGVFVRPEKVEVGNWPVLEVGEEDEEI